MSTQKIIFQVVLSLISTNKNLIEYRSAGYQEPSAESHGFEGGLRFKSECYAEVKHGGLTSDM